MSWQRFPLTQPYIPLLNDNLSILGFTSYPPTFTTDYFSTLVSSPLASPFFTSPFAYPLPAFGVSIPTPVQPPPLFPFGDLADPSVDPYALPAPYDFTFTVGNPFYNLGFPTPSSFLWNF